MPYGGRYSIYATPEEKLGLWKYLQAEGYELIKFRNIEPGDTVFCINHMYSDVPFGYIGTVVSLSDTGRSIRLAGKARGYAKVNFKIIRKRKDSKMGLYAYGKAAKHAADAEVAADEPQYKLASKAKLELFEGTAQAFQDHIKGLLKSNKEAVYIYGRLNEAAKVDEPPLKIIKL